MRRNFYVLRLFGEKVSLTLLVLLAFLIQVGYYCTYNY